MTMLENLVVYGDCKQTLREWADMGVEVQTCVTSPPYWGLRDYGMTGQFGLERTPEEYVAQLVEVFREVKRVLSDDGTLWLNIGDSYGRAPEKGGSGPNGKNGYGEGYTEARHILSESKGSSDGFVGRGDRAPIRNGCVKPKDLVGIPWMLAFALRADGWYLRQDIIWSKTNPMPESVKDRCTRAHEYLFMFSKSERYFYDHAAIKEPCVCSHPFRFVDGGEDKQRGHTRRHAGFNGRYKERIMRDGAPTHRNKRSVWEISTKPFKGAHFATFPPDLIEPCILAGSRPNDIILDPFMGSGTTAMVALRHGRCYLGCELNPAYKTLVDARIESVQPLPVAAD